MMESKTKCKFNLYLTITIFIFVLFTYVYFQKFIKNQNAILRKFNILYLFNYKLPENKFTRECYNFINGEQRKKSIRSCFVHSYYRHLLSCHLGVAPSEANNGKILVLGSSGIIGLAFTKLLKEKKISFVEIRGRLHFDLNNTQIYEIFDKINITHVYDLVKNEEGEKVHDIIFDFFNKKGVIVTRVVENQLNSKYDQIIAPKAFGNQYLKSGVSILFNHTFRCIVKNECNRTIEFNNTKLTPVNEISQELIKTLSHKGPNITKPSFDTFTENEIWNKMLSYKQNKLDKNDKFYEIFDDIYNSFIERSRNPFASIGYLTTNDDSHVSKIKNTLKMYEKVLNEYPDISLEIILFWVKNNNSKSFIESCDLGENLQKNLRVFEISNEMINKMMNILGTTYIPEYFFRDIEVRLGRGELLMTGSADTYPSPAFFEIVQRKLIGPFTILRSMRINAFPYDDIFPKYLHKVKKVESMLANSHSPYKFWNYYDICVGPFGDMQGALRKTLFKINGWIYDKFVWAVDTALIWDLTMFKVPFYSVEMRYGMHQNHNSVSYNTPKFVIKLKSSKRNLLLCNGIPTKNMDDYVRPNWGISFDFGVKNSSDAIIKYGHLVYDIVPSNNSKLNYNISDFSFRVFYNDHKYY